MSKREGSESSKSRKHHKKKSTKSIIYYTIDEPLSHSPSHSYHNKKISLKKDKSKSRPSISDVLPHQTPADSEKTYRDGSTRSLGSESRKSKDKEHRKSRRESHHSKNQHEGKEESSKSKSKPSGETDGLFSKSTNEKSKKKSKSGAAGGEELEGETSSKNKLIIAIILALLLILFFGTIVGIILAKPARRGGGGGGNDSNSSTPLPICPGFTLPQNLSNAEIVGQFCKSGVLSKHPNAAGPDLYDKCSKDCCEVFYPFNPFKRPVCIDACQK